MTQVKKSKTFFSRIGNQCSPNFPGTVELVTGEYYPNRIVYTNANLTGSIGLQVALLNGITSQDFSWSVFSYVNSISSVCVGFNTNTEDLTPTSSIESSSALESRNNESNGVSKGITATSNIKQESASYPILYT